MRRLKRVYGSALPILVAIMAVAALVFASLAGFDWGP